MGNTSTSEELGMISSNKDGFRCVIVSSAPLNAVLSHAFYCIMYVSQTVGQRLTNISRNNIEYDIDGYIPIMMDPFTYTFRVFGDSICLQIVDTAGQTKFRKYCYDDADVFILLCDLTDRQSYDDLLLKWFPEIIQNAAGTSIVVGCNTQSRDPSDPTHIQSLELEVLRNAIQGFQSLEIDLRDHDDVKLVFTLAAKACMKPPVINKQFLPLVQQFYEKYCQTLKRKVSEISGNIEAKDSVLIQVNQIITVMDYICRLDPTSYEDIVDPLLTEIRKIRRDLVGAKSDIFTDLTTSVINNYF